MGSVRSRNSFQPPRDKIQKFPEVAPVFKLEDMLKAEAEKLRMRVEEASLMAAKAVEEAEEKVQELAHEAASEIPEKEIEDMVNKKIPQYEQKCGKSLLFYINIFLFSD